MRDEWDNKHRYRMTEIYFPEAKAMVFDLKAAKELPPFKPERNQRI